MLGLVAAMFVVDEPGDLVMAGGASVVAAPLYALRSGNPGERTSAAFRAARLQPGAALSRVQFAYRYDTGFGPPGVGANFSLRVGGATVYASPRLTDYSYDHNRSNYSRPVAVDAAVAVRIGAGAGIELAFDNNGRNVQLLLPLTVRIECAGPVGCIPPPPPPPSRRLVFETPPSLVMGPERPLSGGGPWFDKVHALSTRHAVGWAESALVATADGGRTWFNPRFNDTGCDGKTAEAMYPGVLDDCGAFHTPGEQRQADITGSSSTGSTRYFVDGAGAIAREAGRGVAYTGLPELRMLGGSGGYATLRDGSLVGVAKAVLATGSGRLSCVAFRSVDGGYHWTFAAVVASAEQVPYASEGPSEGALALLKNGTLMAVMRVDGQSGHYHSYVSALSDDGGRSWRGLRSLGPGVGCVRPRLMAAGGSLVLAGGRPNPTSRDVLLWLNPEGDGEQWDAYSVSYWHNRLTKVEAWKWDKVATNDSRSFPRIDTSYTSLLRTGEDTGYLFYGMGVRAFTLGFRIV